MPIFHLLPIDDFDADEYWIQAASETEARRTIAAAAGVQAEDPEQWECMLNAEKTPPAGLIYRHKNGPLEVS